MKNLLTKLKELAIYMNKKGIPMPIMRDEIKPSVSFTLLVVSSVFVMLGLLSFALPVLQVSFWEALAWHATCAVLYYNRGAKVSKDGIELTTEDKE